MNEIPDLSVARIATMLFCAPRDHDTVTPEDVDMMCRLAIARRLGGVCVGVSWCEAVHGALKAHRGTATALHGAIPVWSGQFPLSSKMHGAREAISHGARGVHWVMNWKGGDPSGGLVKEARAAAEISWANTATVFTLQFTGLNALGDDGKAHVMETVAAFQGAVRWMAVVAGDVSPANVELLCRHSGRTTSVMVCGVRTYEELNEFFCVGARRFQVEPEVVDAILDEARRAGLPE